MKTYKLFAMGARSAGKTCFLAAFYKQLSVTTKDTIFSLVPLEKARFIGKKDSPTKENRLINIYNQIESSGDWPLGTQDIEDWEFDCVVQTKNGRFDILRLIYHDYRGGLLTDDSDNDIILKEDLEQVERKLKSSDAVLFFIDGHKLLNYLEGKNPNYGSSLSDDLNHLLPRMHRMGAKPVQFIITKWDLFETKQSKKFSLAEIKERLLENEQFAELVNFQRENKRKTRLIPVSAVGKGFATISEDQTIKKIPNVKAKPYQVEMTLACMLVDGFDSAYKKIYPWQRKTLDDLLLIGGKLSQVSFAIAAAVVLTLPIEPQYKFMYTPTLAVLFKWGSDETSKYVKEIMKIKRSDITNKKTATFTVITQCKYLEEKLQEEHPASLLF